MKQYGILHMFAFLLNQWNFADYEKVRHDEWEDLFMSYGNGTR